MSLQKHSAANKKAEAEAPPPIIERPFFSIDETSVKLDVSRPTIYAMIEKGQLKSSLIGRRRVITRANFEKYVNALSEQDAPLPSESPCNNKRGRPTKGPGASVKLTAKDLAEASKPTKKTKR